LFRGKDLFIPKLLCGSELILVLQPNLERILCTGTVFVVFNDVKSGCCTVLKSYCEWKKCSVADPDSSWRLIWANAGCLTIFLTFRPIFKFISVSSCANTGIGIGIKEIHIFRTLFAQSFLDSVR
jgi:hypothetical protein